MQYLKNKILELCNKGIKDPSLFYADDVIKQKGKTKDTKEYTYDVVADYIIKNKDDFNKIKAITRKHTYNMSSHKEKIITNSNREEENLAKKLLGIRGSFGKIIAYQIPLKNKRTDKAGKIDLLSINFKEKKVYAIELKKENNKETMLRCAMEAYTYTKVIDKNKLLSDFRFPENYEVLPATLTFYNKEQYNEYKNGKNIKKLMKELEIKPFFIQKNKNRHEEFYEEVIT